MKPYVLFIPIIIVIAVITITPFPSSSHSSMVVVPMGATIALSSPPTPAPMTWTLVLTGDIIPARVVNQKMVQKQDFNWPLAKIKHVLQNADITLANLEAPLLRTCPVTNEGLIFCGSANFAPAMNAAGIDIVNLANNHTLNYGWHGLEETKKHLESAGIAWTGFGKETIIPVQNKRIGFLGYNGVGKRFVEEKIRPEIEQIRQVVDFLIVSAHWGKEYERYPIADSSLALDDPKIWGRKFIDWGADIVAGNHPHWYQMVEWYKDKPIFYALGNTVFDQEWSIETKRGFLAKLFIQESTIDRDRTVFYPIGIRDYGQAYLLEGEEKEEALRFLKEQ